MNMHAVLIHMRLDVVESSHRKLDRDRPFSFLFEGGDKMLFFIPFFVAHLSALVTKSSLKSMLDMFFTSQKLKNDS